MTPRTILQIVPRRTIVPDGVGDYSTRLAEGLRSAAGIKSVFLQGTPSSLAPPRNDGWQTASVSTRSSEALIAALDEINGTHNPVAAIVHVSLYGYQKRGVPFWLAEGLKCWRAGGRRARLIMIFHETWTADARNPLRSSFWLAPAQRRIVRAFYGMADAALTTTARYAKLLRHTSALGPEATIQNVFSNVGEPQHFSPTCERLPRLAVFGGAGISSLAHRHPEALRWVLEALAIREIVDIGARAAPFSVSGIPVKAFGLLPAPEISSLLLTCRAGLLPYGNRSVLGKSTILAAFAAHGVVPVALEISDEDADGLIVGEHYLVAGRTAERDLETMQACIYDWYRSHSLPVQAGLIAGIVDAVSAADAR